MEIPIIKGQLTREKKVLIMVHGRGASAEDIVSIADHLPVADFTLIAPQAPGHTWYPFSFIVPQAQNEPYLTASLDTIDSMVKIATDAGVSFENIYFLGFSQGACLTLEYVTRNAKKWGGVIAFTGGLIGDKLILENYKGDFNSAPVYIGTSNPDPHVPVSRVRETDEVLKKMNASVQVEIFDNMGHTINQKEIISATKVLTTNKASE
jgi:phospholipase/carboxylesterase